MKKIIVLFMLCLFATGCASTGGKNHDKSDNTPSIPLLFADWQYKGFGKEYPLWAENALKQGETETIQIQFGQNLDMLIPHEYEEAESNVVKETWVYIDPYYEEYEYRYAYIKIVEE